MTKLTALVFAADTTPGPNGPREMARLFAFKTDATIEEVEAPGFLRNAEIRSINVGETMQISGPGYVRQYAVESKQGEHAVLRRLDSEDGPDVVRVGVATIPAGEVHTRVEIGCDAGVSITPDRPCRHWITGEKGVFDIEIETADVEPINFVWQVFPL